MNPRFIRITNFLGAFLGLWAIQLSLGITVRNPLTVVLFVCLFMGMEWVSNLTSKREISLINKVIFFGVPALLAGGIMLFVGKRASASFSSSLFKAMTYAILFAGYHVLILFVVRTCLRLIKRDAYEKVPDEGSSYEVKSTGGSDESTAESIKNCGDEISLFITAALVCFICYLPYYLYEFPGIMTADSLVQYGQIIGKEPLSNHHPIIHTMLIKFFYMIGMGITHDPVKAISFYTFFQMVFMSLCGAFLVREVMRVLGYFDRTIAVLTIIFLALMPFNAVFAVTIWKDVPFAGIAVLLSCHLSEMYRKRDDLKVRHFIILSFLLILFSLFRSNAFYASVVLIPFLIYFFRKKIAAVAAFALVPVIIVLIVKGPVFDMCGVKGPDFTESLSLPIQQVARVLADGGTVTDDDLTLIDAVIDRTYVKELYVANYADNMKELVRAGRPEVLENNKGEYLRLWARIGLSNPLLYLRAWYDLEGGYIYPDVAYSVGDVDGVMANDMGLYSSPIIGGKFIKVKEILLKLSDFMPIYGMFFSIGAYTWALVISLCFALKKRCFVLVHVLMLLIVWTLLVAAPVMDFRYAYAMVLSFPLWIVSGAVTK